MLAYSCTGSTSEGWSEGKPGHPAVTNARSVPHQLIPQYKSHTEEVWGCKARFYLLSEARSTAVTLPSRPALALCRLWSRPVLSWYQACKDKLLFHRSFFEQMWVCKTSLYQFRAPQLCEGDWSEEASKTGLAPQTPGPVTTGYS